MRTWAVTNQKGGSGKTAAAVNVAAALGELGKRVLVVDLDPQCSASRWLGVKDGGRGLHEVLTKGRDPRELVVEATAPGVELVPSSEWLWGVEAELAGTQDPQRALARAFSKTLSSGPWEWVFFDCPPSLGLLAVSALVAAREVLVPVEASTMALDGLSALQRTVDLVRERLHPELRLSAILASRVDYRENLGEDVVGLLRKHFGRLVLKTVVRQNVKVKEAPSWHKPVTLYDPRSAGAEDYRAVASELLKRKPE